MLTDRSPRLKALLAEFRASERLAMLELPQDDRLRRTANAIEAAMKAEERNAGESTGHAQTARTGDNISAS